VNDKKSDEIFERVSIVWKFDNEEVERERIPFSFPFSGKTGEIFLSSQ